MTELHNEGASRDTGGGCRNMHENVETWEDTCVCEAEPRWQALGEELEQQARAAAEAAARDRKVTPPR